MDGRSIIDRGKMNQAEKERRRMLRPFSYRSSSFSMETFNSLNKKKHLERSTTNPQFFVHQNSMSKLVSEISSEQLDQHRYLTKKPLQDSRTIRRQCSVRTDDSNILTLKSSRRKDGLSLDLASIALGRTIQVEAVPAPVASERTRQLTNKAKPRQYSQNNYKSPTSLATENKRTMSSYRSDTCKRADILRSYYRATVVPRKHGVVASASAESLLDSVYGNLGREQPSSEKRIKSPSLSRTENVQINEVMPEAFIKVPRQHGVVSSISAESLLDSVYGNRSSSEKRIKSNSLVSLSGTGNMQINEVMPEAFIKVARQHGVVSPTLTESVIDSIYGSLGRDQSSSEKRIKSTSLASLSRTKNMDINEAMPDTLKAVTVATADVMSISHVPNERFEATKQTISSRQTKQAFQIFPGQLRTQNTIPESATRALTSESAPHMRHIPKSASLFEQSHQHYESVSAFQIIPNSQESISAFQSINNNHGTASAFELYRKPFGSTSDFRPIENPQKLTSAFDLVHNFSESTDILGSSSSALGSTSTFQARDEQLESNRVKPVETPFHSQDKTRKSTFQARDMMLKSTFRNRAKPVESTFQSRDKPLESTFPNGVKPVETSFHSQDKTRKSTFLTRDKTLESTFLTRDKTLESTFQSRDQTLESTFQARDKPLESTFHSFDKPHMSVFQRMGQPQESTFHSVLNPLGSTFQSVGEQVELTVQSVVDKPLESTVQSVDKPLESTVQSVDIPLESTVQSVDIPLESTVQSVDIPLESTVQSVDIPLESTVQSVDKPLESTVQSVVDKPLESTVQSMDKPLESTVQSVVDIPLESTVQSVDKPLESTVQSVVDIPLESTVQSVDKPLESTVQSMDKPLESTVQSVDKPLESTVQSVVDIPLESTVQSVVDIPLESTVQSVVDIPLESTVQSVVDIPLESTVQSVDKPLESTVQSMVDKPLESTVQSVDKPLESTVQSVVDIPLESTVQSVVDIPLESTVQSVVDKPLESTVQSVDKPLESTVQSVDIPLESTVQSVDIPLESTVQSMVDKPLESTVQSVDKPLESTVQSVVDIPLESTVQSVVDIPLESTVQSVVDKPLESTVQSVDIPLESTVQSVDIPLESTVQSMDKPLESTVQSMDKPLESTVQSVDIPLESTVQSVDIPLESTVQSVDIPLESTVQSMDKPLESTVQSMDKPLESTVQSVDKPLESTVQSVDIPLESTVQSVVDKPLESTVQSVDIPLESTVQSVVDKPLESTVQSVDIPLESRVQNVDKPIKSTVQSVDIPSEPAVQSMMDKPLELTVQSANKPLEPAVQNVDKPLESTIQSVDKPLELTVHRVDRPLESTATFQNKRTTAHDNQFFDTGMLKLQSESLDIDNTTMNTCTLRSEHLNVEEQVDLPPERTFVSQASSETHTVSNDTTQGSSNALLKQGEENSQTCRTVASNVGLVTDLKGFEKSGNEHTERQGNIEYTTAKGIEHGISRPASLNISCVKCIENISGLSGPVSKEVSDKGSPSSNNDSDSDETNSPPPLPLSSPPQLPSRSTTEQDNRENLFNLQFTFPGGIDGMDLVSRESEIQKSNMLIESTVDPGGISTSLQFSEPGENLSNVETTFLVKINNSQQVCEASESCKFLQLIELSEVPTETAVSLQLSEPSRTLPSKDTSHKKTAGTESSTSSLTMLDLRVNLTNISRRDCSKGVAETPVINSCRTEPTESNSRAIPSVTDRRGDRYRNMLDTVNSVETPSGKTVKSSNPSEYGFVYSADRPVPPPEAGWIEKQGDEQKISLYSENVLKEGDTTESVDRESIADLSTTKKQWESIFTSHNINQEDSSIKKKTVPKWEVRIPYKEKHVISSPEHDSESSQANGLEVGQGIDGDMFKKQIDTESAIEREIRLAHEREEIVRKEKEIREKHALKQKNQGQTIITSYEAESESFHPVYNELAEADRGSDLWGRGLRNRKESEDDGEADQNDESSNLNESIIEREIRLQKEKEEEIARIRKPSTNIQQIQKQEQQSQVQQQQSVHQEVKDVNHNKTKVVSYEEAIAKNTHEGESLIARELRELKEREEELKKVRGSQSGSHTADEVDGSAHPTSPSQTKSTTANSQRSSQVETPSGLGLWQRDVSAFVSQQRRESDDSSHGSVRTPSENIPSRHDVRVRPISDGNSDEEDKKPNYFEKQETPIEREMRLARERENELRRQKGLPEVVYKAENSYSSFGASPESINSSSVYKPRSVVGQPNESMRKFATSRLQHEVQKQHEREHELRSQGKLISTSEEHIEPKKYMEIAGLDKVDGTEKRNFISKKVSVSHSEADTSLGGQAEAQSSGGQMIRKTSTFAAGGNMFSYKEFKQTAESKIERELREMREREDELRKQRTSSLSENIP